MVITRLNAVHALLYLIVSLLSVALIFFTLGAPFVAALEVIIYAGAIMVLFVFVIMMLNLGPQAAAQERQWLNPRACGRARPFWPLVLMVELVYMLRARTDSPIGNPGRRPESRWESPYSALTSWALNWRPCCLLAGLVGAYHLGRRPGHEEKGRRRRDGLWCRWRHGLILAGILFALGLIGVLVRRNIIFILLSIEIMLNAAGLAFVVAGSRWGQPDGQVMFMLHPDDGGSGGIGGPGPAPSALSPFQDPGRRRRQRDARMSMLELLVADSDFALCWFRDPGAGRRSASRAPRWP